jgi:hypothetical protein
VAATQLKIAYPQQKLLYRNRATARSPKSLQRWTGTVEKFDSIPSNTFISIPEVEGSWKEEKRK